MTFNAAERKDIRRAEKAAAQLDANDRDVICALMSHTGGRWWMYNRLAECHLFHNPFSPDTHMTAFGCGEMNVGQRLMASIMQYCPDAYIQMVREQNDRNSAAERPSRPHPDRGDQGPGPDYDGGEEDPGPDAA